MRHEATEEIGFKSATELRRLLDTKQLSCREVATSTCDRIEALNESLNAFVWYERSDVLKRADALDADLAKGDIRGPLHGVPYSIKDVTPMAGLPCTSGLVPLKDYVPEETAPVAKRLEDAGGLFIGRTNTPAIGHCGITDNLLFGATRNPWDLGRHSGGSSGGAAAAVAAGIGPIAEGSDGGGSVRIPASFCGIYGLKPSLGRIPQTIFPNKFGIFPNHGPLSRTVEDAALMLSVVSGYDKADPLSRVPDGGDFLAATARPLAGKRIAWSPDMGGAFKVDQSVVDVCRAAAHAFEALGAEVVEASPDLGDVETIMWEGCWAMAAAEVNGYTDWDALTDEQLDWSVRELIEEGRNLTALQVAEASVARSVMWDAFMAFYEKYDLFITPTLAVTAFPVEQYTPKHLENEPLRAQILNWFLTHPFNLLNPIPAASVPAGFDGDGLPVGLQIAGHPGRDDLVLNASAAFERAKPWADRRPTAIAS